MDWLNAVLNVVKFPVKIFIGIAILAFSLLVMPSNILAFLSLNNFIVDFRQYISLIFLLSITFIIINIGVLLVRFIKKQIAKKKLLKLSKCYEKIIENKISRLDPEEKSLLREYFIQNKNTIKLPIKNGAVANLIQSHIIEQVGNIGESYIFGIYLNFKISDYANSVLTNEMIDFPRELTENEIMILKNNRPSFTKRLSLWNNFE